MEINYFLILLDNIITYTFCWFFIHLIYYKFYIVLLQIIYSQTWLSQTSLIQNRQYLELLLRSLEFPI